MSHTKGPWQRDGSHLYGPDPQRLLIAQMCYIGRGYQEESEANHRLIAAAPDLLEALKLIWSMFDDGRIVRNIANDGEPDWALKMLNFTRELQTIQKAIAKAEGQTTDGASKEERKP